MSRVTKWKLEKAKVKVVFRLQFHAINIPQSGWEKLFISFIPTETGKTIAKTSKANVRNGACKWADPIYETTRLLLDSKTKLYDDKLYRLVVGMGTSRSSILGEATINLADYADASQPSAIALPLHGSDHGTILHVTVQLLTAKTGFREFEQQRDKGLQSGNNVNKESESSIVKSSSSELQITDDQLNKAKPHKHPSVAEETVIREEYSDSHVTCDGSSNASESYYADNKLDPSSTHEVDSIKSRVSGSQSSPGDGSNQHKSAQRSGSDYSMDNDLVIAYEENHRLRGSLEVAESSVSELKMEFSVLQSHANEMGTETQKLAQELATEIASGQELAKEVTVLKSECSKFKNDLEQLKETKSSSKYMERKIEQSEQQKQLRWVNGVLIVEDRIRELQEKIYVGFRESDLSFLNSDLEVLLSMVQDLKKGTVEPESMLHFGKIPSLPLEEPGSTREIDSTEGGHLELLSQLDIEKAERESLVRKMDEMECYYEALVQELEENQKRILREFQSLRNEHSTCDLTISACKAESESIQRDMNDQMARFAEENRELGSVNKELQRRATTSESALKRARLNYSIAVSQLQKDLNMLSFQVLSMFETNQNVLKEAFSDPSQHSVEDLNESDDTLVSNLRSKQLSGGDVLSDDLKKSLNLQENIYKKVEEELNEMSSANLYLDVYSGTLKETLCEASDQIRKMKEKLDELSQELELSNQSRDLLFMRLQTAVEDVHSLNGQNAYCLAKCNDLQLQNQMLETDLGNLSNENFLLMEKITECEALLMDYRVYKSKHEVVSAEKLELEKLLETRVLDNQNLQKDMESMKEELYELGISKENIQKDLEKERDMAALSLSATRSEFKRGLNDIMAKLDTPNSSLEKLQLQLDSFANKFKSSLESKERHVQHNEVLLTYLSSLELELQKMSSEDKNFIEKIMGLDMMAEEFEKSKLAISELKQENQDLTTHVKSKSEESIKLLSELNKLKECLKYVNDELGVEKDLKSKLEGTVASLTSELSHVRKLASDQESENSRVVKLLSLHEENLEKLNKKHSADLSLACQLSEMQETIISEDLKLTFVKSQYETWIDELGKQLQELERKHLDNEARLNQSLASEAYYIEENKELMTTLKSLKMELETSVAQNLVFSDSIDVLTCELEKYKDKVGGLEVSLSNEKNQHAVEVGQLKDSLAKSESEVGLFKELQMKLNDTEARLNDCLENEARYIKEHENLVKTLESVRLELEASIVRNAEISESNNQHAVQLSQLKDMLVKSESEVGLFKELEMKLNDTEARLNDCLENEARYIKEHENLVKILESVRLELEASIVRNAEISESNNQHAVQLSQLKDMLVKSESEVGLFKELEMKLNDTEARLNDCLENEARYIKEHENLVKTLESVRLELEASIVRNAEISESNNQHAVQLSQLKDMLVKSESEIGLFKELEMKLNDTEARLNDCLENEARYINEHENLVTTLESVRLELETSVAHNAEISESNNQHAVELSRLKDMLVKSESEVGQHRELQMKLHDTEMRLNDLLESEVRYIEENGKLATELEYLRLELKALIAQNAEISESNNQQAVELSQLKDMLVKSESEVAQYRELQMKLNGSEARLNDCLKSEVRYIEENGKLATELEYLRLELKASIAQNAEISEKWKDKVGMLEISLTEVKNQHAAEVGQLKEMLAESEVEIKKLKELETKLLDTKERLDHCIESEARYIEENDKLLRTVESLRSDLDDSIKVGSRDASIFVENNNLKCTLAESVSEVDDLLFSREESEMVTVVLKAKLEEQNAELILLQNKATELTKKLAEQIQKTEEFKNLSIYLKELKDNADVAREKKDPEGPSESLRMAFVKEQYQTKMQELKQQLSVSKRHGEEMLFKLQDALDEIESRKKSEAFQSRRIEELSLKIAELEAEIQSATSDKPDYDRIRAELECALLSLECCKEEKEKVVALLQECEEEKSKIVVELSLIKEQLAQKEENSLSDKHLHMGLNGSMDYKEAKSATLTQTGEAENSIIPVNVRAIQGDSASEGVLAVTEHASTDEENSWLNDSKQLTVVNDQFRAQHLRSCMEQLDEELEKMKNDNSLLPTTNYDPSFQDLQRELVQLRKANEELGSIYPNFIDLPGNGNALERVLALEIELAEALGTKKKSSIQFQSSFLKQHSDEEAVFKSFRDINELIKDMLEIKGKYVNVETELKEMHDRYSQLSLQFAEVEGERQKLMMTLKNVRSSRNMLRLNRSPIRIPTREDHHHPL